jgi:hypothetical protein
LRWRDYKRHGASCTAHRGGWWVWEKKLLAATDRTGHRAFQAISDAGQKAISVALLYADGFVTYERIAKDERIPHFELNARRRTKRTRRRHHTNTVNALSRFRIFM